SPHNRLSRPPLLISTSFFSSVPPLLTSTAFFSSVARKNVDRASKSGPSFSKTNGPIPSEIFSHLSKKITDYWAEVKGESEEEEEEAGAREEVPHGGDVGEELAIGGDEAASVLSILGSESSLRDCENQSMELFDHRSFHITTKFLKNLETHVEEPAARIKVLLQAYVSQFKLDSFVLVADAVFVQESAGRIVRATYEIGWRRGRAVPPKAALDLCEMKAQFQEFRIVADWGSESSTYRTLDRRYEMRQVQIFKKMAEEGQPFA
ncbi:Pre-mRNA-splicing helicase BRR2, partial [Marasmius crinis-equi]